MSDANPNPTPNLPPNATEAADIITTSSRNEFVDALTGQMTATMAERQERSLGGFTNDSPTADDEEEFLDGVARSMAEGANDGGDADGVDPAEVEGAPDVDANDDPAVSPTSAPDQPSSTPGPGTGQPGTTPDADLDDGAPGGQSEAKAEGQPTALPEGWSQADVDSAKAVYEWAKTLTPDAVQAFDMLLGGTHVLIARDDPRLTGNVTTTTTTDDDGGTNDDDEDYLDPALARELRAVKQQLAETQEQVNARLRAEEEARLAARQQEWVAAVDNVATSFSQSHNLTTEDMDRLMAETVSMGIIDVHLQRHGGNFQAALNDAFEATLWQVPEFRERQIQAKIAQETNDAEAERQALLARKQRAGAVSSGSGSAPRVDPVPVTKADRERALAEGIAAAMSRTA